MKTLKLILLLILLIGVKSIQSQNVTITKNVLVAPCNCNGEIEYTFNGLTNFPATVSYYFGGNNFSRTITTNKDTLKNLCNGSGEVSVYASPQFGSIFDVNNRFTITNQTILPAICPAMGSLGLTLTGGTLPYSYSCVNTVTNTVVGTTNPISVPAGEYTFTVTDASGCTYRLVRDSFSKGDTNIIQDISSIQFTINTTPAACTNGTATISGLAGGTSPYTQVWHNGATTIGITGLSLPNGLPYFAQVTDAQGCKAKQFFYLQQNPAITVMPTPTQPTCIQSNGSILAFGSGGQNPYTFQWSTGATGNNLTGVPAGFYSVTATDANGCVGYRRILLSASTPITVTNSVTASNCTSPTGSATLTLAGGTAPYTTTWNIMPSASGVNLTNKAAGTYPFQVTDAAGCVQSGSVIIPQISTPSVNISATNPICPATTGSLSSSATGVSPLTYSWSNGAITQVVNNVIIGGYALTVTDGNSCKAIKFKSVSSISSVQVNVNTTNASCRYTADGGAVAAASPAGTYIYNWSGSTSTGSTASSLRVGYHTVRATAANGCSDYKNFYIDNNATTDACYCTISGKVFHDANNNCVQDAGENGIGNIMMHLEGFGSTYTDGSGQYAFQAPSGTYKLKQQVKSIFPMSSCQVKEYTVTVSAASGCVQTFNFADSLIPSHDLMITTINSPYTGPIVPGENYTQRIITKNEGNVTESTPKIHYKHDGQITMTGVSANLATSGTKNVVQGSSFPAMAASQIKEEDVHFLTPTNIPMGTLVVFEDTIAKGLPLSTEWLNDLSPWDNVNFVERIVVSSYDPNYKEVYPAGKGPEGDIPAATKQLTYTVHFQNLGTYYAKKVEIIDTLDTDLDWTTLNPITASHKFTTFMDDNGVVKFLFDKIYLPCEKDGGDASNGYVTYAIKPKKNLPELTKITNFADIYFDYNAPIRTNTAKNRIEKAVVAPVSIREVEASPTMTVYPNPAVDQFKIKLELPKLASNAKVSIYDLQGKQIYYWSGRMNAGVMSKEFNTDQIPAGLYHINAEVDGKVITEKLKIEK